MLYPASCQTNYDIGMSEIHLPLIISMRASDSEATSWQLPTPSLRSLVPNFLPALPKECHISVRDESSVYVNVTAKHV